MSITVKAKASVGGASFLQNAIKASVSRGLDAASRSYVRAVRAKCVSYKRSERMIDLANSVHFKPIDWSRTQVRSNLVYSRIMEFGGVIRPKYRRYLAVPLNDAGKRVANYAVSNAPEDRETVPKSLYGLFLRGGVGSNIKTGGETRGNALFVIRSKKGNLLLVSRGSKKFRPLTRVTGVKSAPQVNAFDPLFVLKLSVTHPSRPYMRPTMTAHRAEAERVFRVGFAAAFAPAVQAARAAAGGAR